MRVDVGDVILAEMLDFNKEIKVAMFVVCYHESYDDYTSNNFTAIKISSEEHCYQIKLLKEYLPFLNHDSFLNCNSVFRFREQQVIGKVGRLNAFYLNKVLQQTQNYYNKMKEQIIRVIGPNNLFEDFSNPQTRGISIEVNAE